MNTQINIERFSSFYHYNFAEGYRFDGHSHQAWEINLILNGEMSVTYGSKILTLSKGDFFVGAPWVFHCNRAIGSNAEMVVIQFYSKETSDEQGFSARTLSDEEFTIARLLASEMSHLCRSNGKVADGADLRFTDCRKLCEVLLSRVRNSENTAQENLSRRAQLYRGTVKYMETHIQEKLSINHLAGQMYVSPALLKNIFLEYTGGGIMTYFTEMKILYAKKLLEQGKSVSFVSDTLGFSSQCYFSTVFGKVAGLTPKQYQKGVCVPSPQGNDGTDK